MKAPKSQSQAGGDWRCTASHDGELQEDGDGGLQPADECSGDWWLLWAGAEQ